MNLPEDLKSKDLKAVFTDLDGTLIDSLPKLYEIYLTFLRNYGIEGSLTEFHEVNGPSLPEVIEILRKRHQLTVSVEELIQQYQEEVYKIYGDESILMPNSLETLQLLHKKGVKLAMVTSASREYANFFLTQSGLAPLFQDVITGDMVKRGKPDPEIYHLALTKTSIHPNQGLVIEDSLHGVKSALGAGIYTLRLNPYAHKNQWHSGWMEVRNWDILQAIFSNL